MQMHANLAHATMLNKLHTAGCLQIIGGIFQSSGWPSVVAIMANWYGKGKRGLVMGIWNAHTSLGNILGTVIAAACLQYGWGYSFVLPGLLMSVLGLVLFALLVVQPSDVGFGASYETLRTEDVVSLWVAACHLQPCC